MGEFLSKPKTEKDSFDDSCNRLSYGTSSMQGWRKDQEDAHNCIMEYDKNTSFFAVYDGHGGPEVSKYCSEKLPDFIKNSKPYQDGDIETALIEGFLAFDGTLTQPEAVRDLENLRKTYFANKKIVKRKKKRKSSASEDYEGNDDDVDVENIEKLHKEATMPITKVIEELKNEANDEFHSGTEADSSNSKCSTKLKENSINIDNVTSSSSDLSEAKSSLEGNDASTNQVVNSTDNIKNGPELCIPEIKITSADSSDSKEAIPANHTDLSQKNGEIVSENCKVEEKNNITSSSELDAAISITKKGKGKAIIKPEKLKRSKRNIQQLNKKSSNDEENNDEESDDEASDKTYTISTEINSDGDDNDNSNISNETEETTSETESAENQESSDDDDDNDDIAMYLEDKWPPASELPYVGIRSGCTAVVAILKGNELYVANVGDSRCLVCRNGKTIPLSFDHKPQDQPELERIKKAGGFLEDGRVDGCLNLSRAIGDHGYKQNKLLSNREQRITALPDIKTLTLNPNEDEFMVLACDGIWNVMSNEQVVEFVKQRLEKNMKLSKICEELFDNCLEPSNYGDGTDNMTVIIVTFKSNILKRASPTELTKTEDNLC